MARALMLQGTGSNVGKSLLVAGLCRALVRRGFRVRPFKPQNMSNNAAVTPDGGEIGRAQALQALACGVAPSVDMNPVLLKPQSETGAQVVVRGQVLVAGAQARAYQQLKPTLLPAVLDSFQRLKDQADIVVVEGAGSPAEINLRAGDIANMGFALAAQVPVVLVGDIDRGGVIASLVGTHAVIEAAERAQIKGFLINKFRGDPTLFADGMAAITERTGWPGLGLVPWWSGAMLLPAEDAVALDTSFPRFDPLVGGERRLRIAVPRLARISNFDDFDPLAQEPGVELIMVAPGQPIPLNCDVVILPGTKATLADLAFLRAQSWDIDLHAHVRAGGRVWGICGGYQLLGRRIEDPDGVEGPAGGADGLGLLDVETVLAGAKVLTEARGVDCPTGAAVSGYEMHIGRTAGQDCARPMLRLEPGRFDGAVSDDGRIRGCYLHGLFSSTAARAALLAELGGVSAGLDHGATVERALDGLAEHLEGHVRVDDLLTLAG